MVEGLEKLNGKQVKVQRPKRAKIKISKTPKGFSI